jgi:hypothetical protein
MVKISPYWSSRIKFSENSPKPLMSLIMFKEYCTRPGNCHKACQRIHWLTQICKNKLRLSLSSSFSSGSFGQIHFGKWALRPRCNLRREFLFVCFCFSFWRQVLAIYPRLAYCSPGCFCTYDSTTLVLGLLVCTIISGWEGIV